MISPKFDEAMSAASRLIEAQQEAGSSLDPAAITILAAHHQAIEEIALRLDSLDKRISIAEELDDFYAKNKIEGHNAIKRIDLDLPEPEPEPENRDDRYHT